VVVRVRDVLQIPGRRGVHRFPIPHAREIADAPLDAVPQVSWGDAVLAVTYSGLCVGVSKRNPGGDFPRMSPATAVVVVRAPSGG
jgi:hypothetical protein